MFDDIGLTFVVITFSPFYSVSEVLSRFSNLMWNMLKILCLMMLAAYFFFFHHLEKYLSSEDVKVIHFSHVIVSSNYSKVSVANSNFLI